MRALLIANPRAGQKRRDELENYIRSLADGVFHEIRWTTGPHEAEAIAASAIASGWDHIFIAGGDGTINEVVNGILRSTTPETRPTIGLIPTGSCNVLANELCIALPSKDSLTAMLAAHKTREIDVGQAGDRYFTLMAGFGFDAVAVRRVALPIKDVVGSPAYLLSAIATLADYSPSKVKLTVDDDIVQTEAFMILVANVSSYAWQNVRLAPFASLDDGWLDVCVFEKSPRSKVGFISQAMLILAKRHLEDRRVRYYRARKVTIESLPPIDGQLDGEACGQTPVSITLHEKALCILVPAST